ncbi:monocarboxylate transporter 4-like [Watersipora subatra]|uniref:monocarboxylate transporter 4-like n=1 Tax=Watersipora subatra TaxID=2589382 RepID=UPI00355C054C
MSNNDEQELDDLQSSDSNTNLNGSLHKAASETFTKDDANTEETIKSVEQGAWRWVIVSSCFFQNLLVDGTLCSFGTLYVYIIDKFEATSLQASYILSLQLCLQALFSPLASAMIINYGVRAVMMVGAGLMALGTLASGFVSDINLLYLTMGALTGIGMSMLSQTAAVTISFYFDKRRGLANGIATTGSGFGFFIFPPLATYLLEAFGLSGACVILAGIMLHGIVFGALVIPNSNDPRSRARAKGQRRLLSIASLVQLTHTQTFLLTITDQSSMYVANMRQYEEFFAAAQDKKCCEKFLHILKEIAKASFDMKLVKDGAFMLYLTGTVMRQLVGYIPGMFIVSRALHFGIRNEETGFLMSTFGVTNIVGRLLLGFLADLPMVKRRRCYLYGIMAISAGVVTSYNFGPLFYHQMLYCGFFGLFYGCTISMKCTVLTDIIGSEKICTGFGMIMFAAGFTVFLGPASAGWIFDKTSSYDVVFAICGSVLIASGLVVMPALCVMAKQKSPGYQKAKDDSLTIDTH